MKTWQLILTQLWALCFVPIWVFMLVFSPLVLTPHASWIAFILLASPPFIALALSIAMWVARYKENIRWQKITVLALILFPVISTVIPMIILQ